MRLLSDSGSVRIGQDHVATDPRGPCTGNVLANILIVSDRFGLTDGLVDRKNLRDFRNVSKIERVLGLENARVFRKFERY